MLGADACTGESLDAGGSCTVEVTYAPTYTGVVMASLSVRGPPGRAASAFLEGGASTSESLPLRPSSGEFGTIVRGTASGTIEFTLTNVSDEATDVISHAFSGVDAMDARVVTSSCMGVSLDPTESCVIGVRFEPATVGAKLAWLDVTEGPRASSSELTVRVVDVGDPILEPAIHDFGNARIGMVVGPETFTLRNTGGAPTGVITTIIAGTNPSDFTIPSGADTCSGASIPVMGTCTIGVQFSPVAPGARSATLRVTSATSPPLTAALSGIGLAD